MKKKAIIILCLVAFLVLALVWCGKEKEVAIDYGTSELFSQADMDDAVKVILKEFNTFEGCKLYSLSYTSDERCEEELEYHNKHASEGITYEACIVFDSCFRSPIINAGAWEPNTIYTWSWYLARTDNGSWELLSCGYA